jgi:hypothetical protein
MRTILSFFILFLLSSSVIAQKTSVLLFGNISFYHDKNTMYGNNNSSSVFGFTPGVGYGFSDNWTAGVNLGYSKYKNSYTSHSYSVGPFVRYTQKVSEIFSAFGQLSGDYFKTTYSADPDYHGVRVNLLPAIELNIKNGLAVNLNIGGIYFESTKVDGIKGSSNRLSLNLGSGATIGFSKRFGKKSSN